MTFFLFIGICIGAGIHSAYPAEPSLPPITGLDVPVRGSLIPFQTHQNGPQSIFLRLLVLPSLIEGFGLPAIEAAACEYPVVATTAGPLHPFLRS